MRHMCAIAVGLSVVLAGSGWAAPWEVCWEGDVYPEQSGWMRHVLVGGAERSISEGVMTLDSSADDMISDWYTIGLGDGLYLASDEYLSIEWRVHVSGTPDEHDSSVGVYSDDGYHVSFDIEQNRVTEWWTGDYALIEPGEFHTYSLLSTDMREYELSVDGNMVLSGSFRYSMISWASEIALGDVIQGGGYNTVGEWDYLHAAVVPVPGTLAFLLLGAPYVRRRFWQGRLHAATNVPCGRRVAVIPPVVVLAVVLALTYGGVAVGNTIYVYNPTYQVDSTWYDVRQQDKAVTIKRPWVHTYYIYATGSHPGGLGDISSIRVDFDPGYSGQVTIALKHRYGFDAAHDVGFMSFGQAYPGELQSSWVTGDFGSISCEMIWALQVGANLTGGLSADTLNQLTISGNANQNITVCQYLNGNINVYGDVASACLISVPNAASRTVYVGGTLYGAIRATGSLATITVDGDLPGTVYAGTAGVISVAGNAAGTIDVDVVDTGLDVGGSASGLIQVGVAGGVVEVGSGASGGDLTGTLSVWDVDGGPCTCTMMRPSGR